MLRAAVSLARRYPAGGRATLRQVAEETGVSRTFAPQILRDLVRSGLASSTAGAHGGYRLARPPGEVRLLEVVEAGEGSMLVAGCVQGTRPCTDGAACAWHEAWTAARARLRSSLEATSLAELAGHDPGPGAGACPLHPGPPAPPGAAPRPGARAPGAPCADGVGAGVAALRAPGRVAPAGRARVQDDVEEPVQLFGERVRPSAPPSRAGGGGGEGARIGDDGEQ